MLPIYHKGKDRFGGPFPFLCISEPLDKRYPV